MVEPELYRFVEPVTVKLPEIIADPVYGNVVSGAYEADIARDAVKAYEALVLLFEYDAVKAYEALVAVEEYEADIAFCAHDAVPCKDPVMVGAFRLPVIFALPEMITVPFNVCVSAVDVS